MGLVCLRHCLTAFDHVGRLTQEAPAHIVQSVWHPFVHLSPIDVDLVLLVLTGSTNFATTLNLSLPTSGDRPFCGAVAERCDNPSWLRDDDKYPYMYKDSKVISSAATASEDSV